MDRVCGWLKNEPQATADPRHGGQAFDSVSLKSEPNFAQDDSFVVGAHFRFITLTK
jgi:hypothetical protein